MIQPTDECWGGSGEVWKVICWPNWVENGRVKESEKVRSLPYSAGVLLRQLLEKTKLRNPLFKSSTRSFINFCHKRDNVNRISKPQKRFSYECELTVSVHICTVKQRRTSNFWKRLKNTWCERLEVCSRLRFVSFSSSWFLLSDAFCLSSSVFLYQ
jgi:hypothetical protein